MDAYVRKKSYEQYRRKFRIRFPGVFIVYTYMRNCKAVKLVIRLGTVIN